LIAYSALSTVTFRMLMPDYFRVDWLSFMPFYESSI